MKTRWLAALAAVALLVGLFAGSAGADDEKWLTSLDAGLKAAKESNKPLLIDFGATW